MLRNKFNRDGSVDDTGDGDVDGVAGGGVGVSCSAIASLVFDRFLGVTGRGDSSDLLRPYFRLDLEGGVGGGTGGVSRGFFGTGDDVFVDW